jgi:hypothetical protein
MWQNAENLNYPAKNDISILPNGCLVFDVMIAGHLVHYSVWLTFGEIRIGVKIPNWLIVSDGIRKQLIEIFDGNKCSRVVSTDEHTIYDWIFRDGFASHNHMMIAVRDSLASTIIAIRIGEILTHIYLSSLVFLIKANHVTIQQHAAHV